MITGSIALRYARALLDLSQQESIVSAVREHLTALASSQAASRDMRDLFENPAVTREERRRAIESLCSKTNAPRLVVNFMLLLVDRNRLRYLERVALAYGDLADARSGCVRARLSSAKALDRAAVERIESALRRGARRDVVLETVTDPSLLGGVVAQVGGLVLDGSLKGQFEAMRREIAG